MAPYPVHILVLEENQADIEAVIGLLAQETPAYSWQVANSVAHARQVLAENKCDLILLGYYFGETTGFVLFPDARDIPIIVLTRHGSERIAVEALRLGAADYFIKDNERQYLTLLPQAIRSALEQHRHRQEMAQTRFLLADIFLSMPSMLVGLDDRGKITRWNREAEKFTGVPADLALAQTLDTVYPPLAGQMKNIQTVIDTRLPMRDEIGFVRGKNDARLWNIAIYPLSQSLNGGAVVRVDDVTEEMRAQSISLHSEKILSIGGLAAGMAHELNNPLAGMLHNVQVIRNRITTGLAQNNRVAESCGISMQHIENYMTQRAIFPMIDNIVDAGRRASGILDNLLSLSSSGEKRSASHDIGLLLDKAVELACGDSELINKYFFQSIEIGKEYHAPLPPVMCEADKIQKVFFHLLKNGAQAMVEHNKGKRCRFELRIYPKDSFIHVEIEDNGPGITKNIQKRIFDPFFTTRRVGDGIGLGLSVAFSIITRDHGGTMEVKSSPGKGTMFLLRFPLDRRTR